MKSVSHLKMLDLCLKTDKNMNSYQLFGSYIQNLTIPSKSSSFACKMDLIFLAFLDLGYCLYVHAK